MPRPTRAEINNEIVMTAARLFAQQGYQATRLQQVAQHMGYSKAAVLYHFSSKEALLAEAVRAPAEAAEALLDELEAMPSGAERDRTAITRLLDLALEYRVRLGLWLGAAGELPQLPSLERFQENAERVHALLVPPDAALERRVSAAQLEGGLLAVIMRFPEVPSEELRPLLLSSQLRALDLDTGPDARRTA